MAVPNNHQEPTFTIEQIELIRRLRNSGLTKEQVVRAFESFDRVDSELGDIYNIPASATAKLKSFATVVSKAPTQADVLTAASPQAPYEPVVNGKSATPPTLTARPISAPAHVNRRFQGARRSIELCNGNRVASENSDGDVIQMSMQDVCPKAKAVKLYHSQEERTEKTVEEFISQGSDKMHEEIRDFIVENPSFSPSDMSLAAGVGVTCASKFLVGNFMALPSDVLRQLCLWFLKTRSQQKTRSLQQQGEQKKRSHSATKMLREMIQDSLNAGSSPSDTGMSSSSSVAADNAVDMKGCQDSKDTKWDVTSSLSLPVYPDGLDMQFTPRRERFTFRKKHLEILEAVFKTNQYPPYEERLEIADRCNIIMETVASRPLGEKERMTAQNVAYWFSNRRKDIKRIAREGGMDSSEVILPSRVRQSPLDSSGQAAEAAASWVIQSAGIDFSSLQSPIVGPVAFPTVTRLLPENGAGLEAASVSPHAGKQAGRDRRVHIKQEPVDVDMQQNTIESMQQSEQIFFTQAEQGRGTTVDRIAAVITSQLMQSAATSSVTNVDGNDSPSASTSFEVKQHGDDESQDQVKSENDKSGGYNICSVLPHPAFQ